MFTRSQQLAGDGRPVVVFVDLGTMLSFDQLASVLRARGVEVVHLTSACNLMARMSSRVIYHHTAAWHDPAQLCDLLREAGGSRIIDIQCPEFLLGAVRTAAREAGLRPGVLDQLDLRDSWLDKLDVAERLRGAGVPVPATVPLCDRRTGESADAAIAELGLPLVVKARVGSGGEGVRICLDRAQILAAADELSGMGGLYAEPFLTGETLCWAGVVSEGRVVNACVYQTLQQHRAEGPSSSVEVVCDDEIMQIGTRVANQMQGSGMVNLDLVRTADGRPMVVDVNLRAWHSIVALTVAEHDFVQDYLSTLGLATASPLRGRTGRVDVFPDQSESDLHRSRREGALRFLHDMRQQRGVLPSRYIAVQCVLFARRLTSTRHLPVATPAA